mmetsp:Transcript_34713/g.55845  ORF Transcript_34713/g.55845 Transcript_34713/m.55845 type:complete len:230 (+) Transcript_34713:870-1559(+)
MANFRLSSEKSCDHVICSPAKSWRISASVCATTCCRTLGDSSLWTSNSTVSFASSARLDFKSHRGDSGRKHVVVNSPRAGMDPDTNIQRQSLGKPASMRLTRNARGIPTFMNISLELVTIPRNRLGDNSAQYIGQITSPIPTPIPVKQRHIRSTENEGEEAIPIDPAKNIAAADKRPFFLPNLSATIPAMKEPSIDARVILEVNISTSNPERLNSFLIGTIAPLIIPRS